MFYLLFISLDTLDFSRLKYVCVCVRACFMRKVELFKCLIK